MAKIRIKIVRAYESDSMLGGVFIPDMFRALQPPVVIDETKAKAAIETAKKHCEEYAAAHPGESFMPTLTVIDGRSPRGFEASVKEMDRGWLLPKPAHL